jgi:hypothetical protein
VRAQKGYYLEQACTKCMYKRHIAIKQEVDIHEAGDKAILELKYGYTRQKIINRWVEYIDPIDLLDRPNNVEVGLCWY